MLLLLQDLALYVMAALATYTLANHLAYSDGYGDIVRKFRIRLGAEDLVICTAPDGEEYHCPRTSLGKLVSCPYCLAVWIALLMAVALLYLTDFVTVARFPIAWWGLVGVQMYLENSTRRNEK